MATGKPIVDAEEIVPEADAEELEPETDAEQIGTPENVLNNQQSCHY